MWVVPLRMNDGGVVLEVCSRGAVLTVCVLDMFQPNAMQVAAD